jgi:hypothetical protein
LGCWRGLWLRHLLRALIGHDDVALLGGGSLVVDILQRVGPGLADGFATARLVERLTILECVRRLGVWLAVDRHRLVHVFAGIAIGKQRGFGRWAKRFAGTLVVRETARYRGEGDREIKAVAASCADGAIGTRSCSVIDRRAVVIITAEQIVEESAATAVAQLGGILRTAIVLCERHQHRTALALALRTAKPAAAQALKIAGDLVEIGPHLLNSRVDRPALSGLAAEQREESRTVAALPLGLLLNALQLRLLPALGFYIALDLVGFGAVATAGVDCR